MITLKYIFNKFEEFLMMIGMIIMVTLNFTNVVCRYLLPQTPFSYTEELTVLIFVWVSMLGIACGYKWISHTGLTMVTDLLPNKVKQAVAIFATICSTGLFIMVFYEGILMVQNQLKHGQILPGMQIPAATASLAVPVCAIIIIIRVIQAGIKEVKQLRTHEGEK